MRWLVPATTLATALLLIWPTPLHLVDQIPMGSESVPTVARLNLWTLGWNGERLRQGFAAYWEAPIFHPAGGAFAFSDPQPLTAIPAALLWHASPALAYNLTLIAYLALNGWTAFNLVRGRGYPAPVGLAAGLIIQALPFLTNERGVLQLQPLFAPLWAVHALWTLIDHPTPKRAAILTASLAVTLLTSEYFSLYLAFITIFGLASRWRAVRRRQTWIQLGIAGGLALALTAPITIPQYRHLQAMGFSRSESTLRQTSAQPIDYLRPSTRLRLAQGFPDFDAGSGQRLFPGALLSLMATAGVSLGLRSRSSRAWAAYLALIALAGLALSFGPRLRLAGWSPFLALHRGLPGLNWTRSPFRFALLTQMALGLSSAEVLSALYRRKRWLLPLLTGLTLIEFMPLPERMTPVPEASPGWATAAEAAGLEVLAHVPWASGPKAAEFADTTLWMVQSLGTGIKMVNGYSGFFPATNAQLRGLLEDFPHPGALRALEAMGVEGVVVHKGGENEGDERRLRAFVEAGRMVLLQSSTEASLYGLPRAALRPASEYGGAWIVEARRRDTRLVVRAIAAVPDEAFYVYSRDTVPLRLELKINGPGEGRTLPFRPFGSALLWHGSDRWLRTEVRLDPFPGEVRITLIDSGSGETVGETTYGASE